MRNGSGADLDDKGCGPKRSECPMTTLPQDPPPTEDEVAAARRLGVGVDLYRRFKRNAGPGMEAFERGAGPADIAAEQQLYRSLRESKGLFKARDVAPNVFVAAARTPGEVARSLLTIACYLALLLLIVAIWGRQIDAVPGVFQVAGVLVLVLPAMWLSSTLWERIGEGPRDVVRALVRFWPLTLVAGVFALGLLRLLFA